MALTFGLQLLLLLLLLQLLLLLLLQQLLQLLLLLLLLFVLLLLLLLLPKSMFPGTGLVSFERNHYDGEEEKKQTNKEKNCYS